MNTKCGLCKGKGIVRRDGKLVGNRQPFDLVCSGCNGVGHYSVPSPPSFDDD
jgi:DnaJ-class molecular chaperone